MAQLVERKTYNTIDVGLNPTPAFLVKNQNASTPRPLDLFVTELKIQKAPFLNFDPHVNYPPLPFAQRLEDYPQSVCMLLRAFTSSRLAFICKSSAKT